MSRLRNWGLTAVALAFVATAGSARADGLAKFEQLIKPKLPPNSLSYGGAKAIGDNGFELDDVTITPPPDATGGAKAEPVKIHAIVVESADFDAIAKQAPPNFLQLKAEGIVVDKNPAAGIDLHELAGIDTVTANILLDYRLDPAKQTLTLNQLELQLDGLAKLDVSMTLDGVVPDTVANPGNGMATTTLRTASVVYDDQSLLAKAVPVAAKQQNMTPAAAITALKAMLDGFRAGQGAPTAKVFDALESFLEDYQAPKGPLRITFNPPAKTSVAVIMGAKGADDVINALGLAVDYAGTRPQKVAPAVPQVSPATPQSGPPIVHPAVPAPPAEDPDSGDKPDAPEKNKE